MKVTATFYVPNPATGKHETLTATTMFDARLWHIAWPEVMRDLTHQLVQEVSQ